MEQARVALRGASRPVIVAGGGSRGAAEELRELVDTLGAPIVTTLNAKGVVDEHHPLSLGANLRFTQVREYARTADVLLVVGSKLGEAELWVERLEATGTVVRIDLAEGQISKNLTADIGLVGDAKATLRALLDGLDVTSPAGDFRADVAGALEAARAEGLETSRESTLIAEDIVAALPHDAIVSTDSSQICYLGLLNAIKVTTPNSTPYMATYATLGYGLPAALGARIGAPDRPTFAVVGDGALMFSLQELITVVEQGEDLTVIVVDNGGYGEIRTNEISAGIDPVGVELTQPDWPLMAAASGGHGVRVDDLGQLKDAVANAVEAGGLQLIHIDAKRYTTAG
nr:thiamine pyrophosphate-dependent enzyme [Brevibacterium paucivorans]